MKGAGTVVRNTIGRVFSFTVIYAVIMRVAGLLAYGVAALR